MAVRPEIPTDLIRTGIAAKLLGCHLATVYRMVLRGTLRGWKRAGQRYVVSKADVMDLLRPVEPEGRLPIEKPMTAKQRQRMTERTREGLRNAGFTVGV